MSTMRNKSTLQSDKPVIININDPNDLEPDGPESLRSAAGSRSHMFTTVLLNSVVSACWCPSGMTQEQRHERCSMAVRAVAAFDPKDEIEGMIAAQAVAMHLGAKLPPVHGSRTARGRGDTA